MEHKLEVVGFDPSVGRISVHFTTNGDGAFDDGDAAESVGKVVFTARHSQLMADRHRVNLAFLFIQVHNFTLIVVLRGYI